MNSIDSEFLAARRTVFGNVAGHDYDRLLEHCSAIAAGYAAAQDRVAALEVAAQTAQERIATLEAADQARERRIADVLSDAAAVAEGLSFAASELAVLAQPGGPKAEESHLELVLRRLFPRIVAAVVVSPADGLQGIVAELRNAPGGRRTWEGDRVTDAGERPLDSSGALVHDVVVLVRYRPEIYADGDLPVVVERVCHALAASLAAQQRARSRAAERGQVTLLATEDALGRLQALRESQGIEMARVRLEVGAQLRNEEIGLYGEPAWNGIVFDCAGHLDRLARDNGGEAFEVESALCCLVQATSVEAVRRAAQAIAAALGLETEVTVS